MVSGEDNQGGWIEQVEHAHRTDGRNRPTEPCRMPTIDKHFARR